MHKLSFNIRRLRELRKMSQEVLADELKITRARLGAYEEGRNEPPIELLIKISEYFHVPVDVLLKADLRKSNPDTLLKLGDNRLLLPVMIDADNNEMIEVVTQKASAGYLNGYSDPEFVERLPNMTLPFTLSGKHRAFPVKGDSMPPLSSGDFIIGKYVENKNEIVFGKTYVLLTKTEGIVYKRLYKKNATEFELVSDNVSYSPYRIKTSDILEMWQFVCCLKTSDHKAEEINPEHLMAFLKSMKIEISQIGKTISKGKFSASKEK